MGRVGTDSKLLFVVAGLILVSMHGESNFVSAQEDIKLKYDAFRQYSTILADDKLIFFTPVNHNSLASISVQDIKTGSLLYKLHTPHKNLDDDWFGQHMTPVGNNIAVSSIFLDPQTDRWTTMVHMFDGKNGNLLYSIENPISTSVHFGYTLKSLEDKLAVYSSDTDPNDDIHDNVVHVFDNKNGSLLYTIENPLEKGHFGKSISTIDNSFLIHTRQDTRSNLSGTIHAFDADTGKLQYTIEYPQEDTRDIDPYFGGQSIISENYVIVKSGDAVHVFDGNTGDLIQTVDHPVTTASQLDVLLDSLEPVLEKTHGDDAPFFGIFIFFENLFSWIMPSSQEDNVILSEQETHQLIQNEISKLPKITGALAQDACTILDLKCTPQTSFNAIFDSTDGYTKFSYSENSVNYFFRIADDILEYKTDDSTDWRTLEDDFADTFGWGDSLQEKEVVNDNLSHTFYFDSDKLGNYEKWCSISNGTFYPGMTGSKVGCKFANESSADIARDSLREFQKKTISGELAQKLCRAYGKVCEPGIFIKMEYDLETGELYKLKKLDNPSPNHYYTEYRILDDGVIQYRIPTDPPQPWMTFEE